MKRVTHARPVVHSSAILHLRILHLCKCAAISHAIVFSSITNGGGNGGGMSNKTAHHHYQCVCVCACSLTLYANARAEIKTTQPARAAVVFPPFLPLAPCGDKGDPRERCADGLLTTTHTGKQMVVKCDARKLCDRCSAQSY